MLKTILRRQRMTGQRLAPIVAVVTPADMRAVAEAAAGHDTYPEHSVALAPVVDLFTRTVLA